MMKRKIKGSLSAAALACAVSIVLTSCGNPIVDTDKVGASDLSALSRVDKEDSSSDPAAENKIDCTQGQSAGKHHDNRISDAFLRCLRLLFAQAQTDKGAAAVTDHDSNCQRDDRQRCSRSGRYDSFRHYN